MATVQKNKHGGPYWWNPIGALVYKPDREEPNILKFTTRSSHLQIWQSETRDTWVVRWIINSRKGRIKGTRYFTSNEFRSAFRLFRDLKVEKTDPKFAQIFDGEFGLPDLYIRSGRRLNIPGPGTGLPGDTNFSLKLTYWNQTRIQDFMDAQLVKRTFQGPH